MTAPNPTPTRPRARIPKTVWDLIFTAAIPIAILSPNLLGEGIGVASLLGGGKDGNVRAFLLSAAIPIAYVAWDLMRHRTLSPVAMIGGAGAIASGALALGIAHWEVDGLPYAILDSARLYLTALLFALSTLTAVPLFRVLLDATTIGESDADRQATTTALRDPVVHRGLVGATLLFAVMELVQGVINSYVNYERVVAKFGTDDFNAQVAQVNAIMRVPGMVISLIGVWLAISLVQRAVKVRYGADASLFEPAKLAERHRALQAGAAPVPSGEAQA